jgi:hypothetical protein
MTREDVLELIHQKLQTADDEALHDVLLVLSEDYTDDEAFDQALLTAWKAGKHDETIAEVDRNHYSGNTEPLADGVKRLANK